METFYTILEDLQLDLSGVMITGLILFAIGFWLGSVKTKRFMRKIHEMEKEIMDLNSELLYGKKQGNKKMVKASH